jgi:hypothetical protein
MLLDRYRSNRPTSALSFSMPDSGEGRCHRTPNSSVEKRVCRFRKARQKGRHISAMLPESPNIVLAMVAREKAVEFEPHSAILAAELKLTNRWLLHDSN